MLESTSSPWVRNNAHFCLLSSQTCFKNPKVKVGELFGCWGVYLFCFVLFLFIFLRVNLLLFRGEIFTIFNTDIIHLKCMVHPTLTSADIK